METRANYVLIGAFAVAGFLGLLLFLMIFANFGFDRRYSYYDVRFQSVSGLSRASEVRFEGLPVGQVVDVRLAPELDGTILVRLEVHEDTPLRTDSVARISSLGVTGVSYVALSAGDPTLPLLRDTAEIPLIEAERSTLDALFEDAPRVVTQVLETLERVNEVLSDENRGRVDRILINLEQSSENLSGALDDFAEVSRIVADASTGIAEFTQRLEPVADAAVVTMGNVDTTLDTYSDLARRVSGTLDVGDATLESAKRALDTVELFLADDLPVLARDLTETSATLRRQADALGGDARQMITGLSEAGTEATARLREARDTLAGITELTDRLVPLADRAAVSMETIDSTLDTYSALAGRVTVTLDTGDETLVSARRALDTVETFMAGDLPVLTRDLTETSATLRRQADAVSGDARQMLTSFTQAGDEAAARLSEARATLASADGMIARLTETLDTVDRAVGRFDTLLEGDGAALLAEGREMVTAATAAVTAVTQAATEDLPAVMTDIRQAANTAARVVETVGADLSRASGRVDGVLETAQGAMEQVSVTFANANDTLGAINSALEVGERTLGAAERAFAGADRVINEEVSGLIADLRAATQRLDGAIALVSDDIPAVTASLRASAQTANEAFAELGRVVADSGPAVRQFATQALPEYTQIGRETRALLTNLERLLRQIEREPARFFLGRTTPEFSR